MAKLEKDVSKEVKIALDALEASGLFSGGKD